MNSLRERIIQEQNNNNVEEWQIKIEEKDAQIENMKKQLSESQDKIIELEQGVADGRSKLKERDNRINDLLKEEATLRSDVEQQKKVVSQMKRMNEILTKEKEEATEENQALSKQLEELKQGQEVRVQTPSITLPSGGPGTTSEKRTKEKEEATKENQTLSKQLEELKQGKNTSGDLNIEQAMKEKEEKDTRKQEKTKFSDECERRKEDLERSHEEVEKLIKSNLPEGTSLFSCLPASTSSKTEMSSRAESSSIVAVTEALSSDLPKDQGEQDLEQTALKSDRKEGELAPDNADLELGELPEAVSHTASSYLENDPLGSGTENISETESTEVLVNEGDAAEDKNGSEKSIEVTEQTPNETDQISEALITGEGSIVTEMAVSTTTAGSSNPKEGHFSVTENTEEIKQPSPVENNSTTLISIVERAKRNAQLRQASIQTSSPSRARGRGVPRGRGVVRGRSVRGRGPASGEQS